MISASACSQVSSELVLVLRNAHFHTGDCGFWGSWLRERSPVVEKTVGVGGRQEGKAFWEDLGEGLPALG